MIIEREEQVTEAVLSETGQVADPRTRQVLQSLIRHLHAFAREVRLTEREFNTAINLVSRLGQLTNDNHNETRLIAGMAESYYAAIAPHCPLGPISLAK